VVIADGLQPGEKVVTDGLQRLAAGTKVEVREPGRPGGGKRGEKKGGGEPGGGEKSGGEKGVGEKKRGQP
jgi:hypothetical protein